MSHRTSARAQIRKLRERVAELTELLHQAQARYEAVSRMGPDQFTEVWVKFHTTGHSFDELIDAMR